MNGKTINFNLVKKISIFIFVLAVLSANSFFSFASDFEKGKYYSVPIESVTTKAPLKPIKEAFSKVFGDSVTVYVDENGKKIATIQNNHISIDMGILGNGSNYEANLLTIKDAKVLSTKTEKFSNPKNGLSKPSVLEDEEVPKEFQFELNLDENNEQTLTVTVDFMNAFMGNGEPYETDIKLKLDLSKATQKSEETTKAVSTTQSLGVKTVDDSNNIHENKNYIAYTVLTVVGISVVAVCVILVRKKLK